MPSRKAFLLGRHVTVMTVTPCSEANDGTLTAGTAIPLINVKKGLDIGERRMTEEINNDGSGVENEVVLAVGPRASITAMIAVATSVATLKAALKGCNTVKIDSTVNSAVLEDGYYTLVDFNISSQGRGAIMLTLELGPADVS